MSCTSLVLCFAVLLPTQDNKPDRNAAADHTAPKEKLIPIGTWDVKLVSADPGKRIIVVKYPYRKGTKDMELHAVDDLKVRSSNPPLEFDEKGRPRRYTYRELKELKGPDTKLPGYQADFESLKPGQDVRITLAKRKPVAKVQRPKAADDADLDKTAPKPSDKQEVMMIVILREPAK